MTESGQVSVFLGENLAWEQSLYVCLFDWLSVLVSVVSFSFYRQFGPTVLALFLAEGSQGHWVILYLHLYAIRKCFLVGSELVSVSYPFNHKHVTYTFGREGFNLFQASLMGFGQVQLVLAPLGFLYAKPTIQILTQTQTILPNLEILILNKSFTH